MDKYLSPQPMAHPDPKKSRRESFCAMDQFFGDDHGSPYSINMNVFLPDIAIKNGDVPAGAAFGPPTRSKLNLYRRLSLIPSVRWARPAPFHLRCPISPASLTLIPLRVLKSMPWTITPGSLSSRRCKALTSRRMGRSSSSSAQSWTSRIKAIHTPTLTLTLCPHWCLLSTTCT